MSPCRPGGPAWPSTPASPWGRGETWVLGVFGSLSLSAPASTDSPPSSHLPPTHPGAQSGSHLLLAAFPVCPFPPLRSAPLPGVQPAVPGAPQFCLTHKPALLQPPGGDRHAPPATGRQVILEPKALGKAHLSSPAWETEGTMKPPGMEGGGPRGLGWEAQREMGGGPPTHTSLGQHFAWP